MPASAPTPMPPPLSRGRPRTVGLRQSILRAAEGIFTRRDYQEVLMDDVARACGVGKGTLYRYFPGKRELFSAIMFEGMAQLRGELQAVVAAPGSPVHKVERLVHCTLAHFWDRRLLLALIHRNEHIQNKREAHAWLHRRDELARLFANTLEEAMAVGDIRPIDPRIATEMLLGMLRGVNRYRRPEDTLEALVAAVVDTFLSGVGTPSGRRLAVNGRMRRRE